MPGGWLSPCNNGVTLGARCRLCCWQIGHSAVGAARSVLMDTRSWYWAIHSPHHSQGHFVHELTGIAGVGGAVWCLPNGSSQPLDYEALPLPCDEHAMELKYLPALPFRGLYPQTSSSDLSIFSLCSFQFHSPTKPWFGADPSFQPLLPAGKMNEVPQVLPTGRTPLHHHLGCPGEELQCKAAHVQMMHGNHAEPSENQPETLLPESTCRKSPWNHGHSLREDII